MRPIPYAAGQKAFITYTPQSPLPRGLEAGQRISLERWEAPDFVVKDNRGAEHRLYICHLTPAYEIDTPDGWRHESESIALDVLERRLRAIPDGHSDEPHDKVSVNTWNVMLRILRRNGRDMPLDVLREARSALVLRDSAPG